MGNRWCLGQGLSLGVATLAVLVMGPPAFAAVDATIGAPALLGIPIDFVLFGLTLLGVALFHHHTLKVALCGLAVIALYKIVFTGFYAGSGVAGFLSQLGHEWVVLTNLLGLLVGFALLADHFERSEVPRTLPRFLPNDWTGGLLLLFIVFVLSGFLDNIAAALIGGTMAATVFRHRVHIGFLAAIVAAANAGGAGSVVGDTTTTMMWIAGVSPQVVLPAYVAALASFLVFGVPAARLQHRHAPITKDEAIGTHIDWARMAVVGAILVSAVATNVFVNLNYPTRADSFPFLGAAVWVALLLMAPLRRPAWNLIPTAFKGSVFLLALVTCASMMPVEKLPAASWPSALVLGFVSSVFDNIPLTALAIKQGGYDWGLLAFAVGFGGSMVWFGSSAGVAISNSFPEAKSVTNWLRHGWTIVIGYIFGFFVMLWLLGWNPSPRRSEAVQPGVARVLRASSHSAITGTETSRWS